MTANREIRLRGDSPARLGRRPLGSARFEAGPVTFTTLTDDINGDTNEDMDTTVPVPGS